MEYAYPHTGYDMYYVKGGKVEVTIDHSYETAEPQTFIAEADTIIDIPPYHTYTNRVLEDAAVYNYAASTTSRLAWKTWLLSNATPPGPSPRKKTIWPSCAAMACTPQASPTKPDWVCAVKQAVLPRWDGLFGGGSSWRAKVFWTAGAKIPCKARLTCYNIGA